MQQKSQQKAKAYCYAQNPFLHFITQDKEGPVVLCSTYTYAYGKGCKKLLWEEVTFDTVPLSDQKTLATN